VDHSKLVPQRHGSFVRGAVFAAASNNREIKTVSSADFETSFSSL
jgi:hypothetical protein